MTAQVSEVSARYLDVKRCGARYSISWRSWLRLVDAGKAPAPTRFGRLVRWPLASLEAWEQDGCRPVRPRKGGA